MKHYNIILTVSFLLPSILLGLKPDTQHKIDAYSKYAINVPDAGMTHVSLIDCEWLLTAASSGKFHKVIIAGQTYNVLESVEHPSYKNGQGFDVQLLHLDKPVMNSQMRLINPVKRFRELLFDDNRILTLVGSNLANVKKQNEILDLSSDNRLAGINIHNFNLLDSKEHHFFLQYDATQASASGLFKEDYLVQAVPDTKDIGSGVFVIDGKGEFLLAGIVTGETTVHEDMILLDITAPQISCWIDATILKAALKKNLILAGQKVSKEPNGGQAVAILPENDLMAKKSYNIAFWCNDKDTNNYKFLDLMRILVKSAESQDLRILTQYQWLPVSTDNRNKDSYNRILPLKSVDLQDVIDDFRGTRRFVIVGGKYEKNIRERVRKVDVLDSIIVDKDIKLNPDFSEARKRVLEMDNGYSLESFVKWAFDHPAEKNILIIWAHSGGWNGVSGIELPEFRNALKVGLNGKNLNILRFDSCYTQHIESACEFADLAQFIVASQQSTPLDLVPNTYGEMIKNINNIRFDSSRESTQNLALKMLDDYKFAADKYIKKKLSILLATAEYGQWSWTPDLGYTMSLIDTAKLNDLVKKVYSLSDALIGYSKKRVPLNKHLILSLRDIVLSFSPGRTSVDMLRFAEELYENVEDESVCSCSNNIALFLKDRNKTPILKTIFGGSTKGSSVVQDACGLSIELNNADAFVRETIFENQVMTNPAYNCYKKLLFNANASAGSSWMDFLTLE